MFSIASKRYQPYINLTDQTYHLVDLFDDPAIINEYKKLSLKSLYVRVEDNIRLDGEFATRINALAQIGIKEILIFYQAQEIPTTELFNKFLEENKIYINLLMIPITNLDIEKIQTDSIGKKDILGFKHLNIIESRIEYTDGYKLTILNNEETNKIANYILETIEKNGYILEKELKVNNITELQWKRSIQEILDGYGLIKITANKEIKLKYNINVAERSYPKIIVKGGE